MSSILVERLDRVLYPNHEARWDDDLLRTQVAAEIERFLRGAGSRRLRVLDLGAGVGVTGPVLPPSSRRYADLVGIDPDERVLTNPHLSEAYVGRAEELPFPPEHFDLVVANNVVEHLLDPRTVFREVYRVLRPGGVFLFKTPNRIHYVPLVARLTSQGFHQWVNARRGRRPADTFPTAYLANRPGIIRSLGRDAGFASIEVELVEGRPEYLRFCAAAYLAGWAWERAVNLISPLRTFRVVLLVRMEKA